MRSAGCKHGIRLDNNSDGFSEQELHTQGCSAIKELLSILSFSYWKPKSPGRKIIKQDEVLPARAQKTPLGTTNVLSIVMPRKTATSLHVLNKRVSSTYSASSVAPLLQTVTCRDRWCKAQLCPWRRRTEIQWFPRQRYDLGRNQTGGGRYCLPVRAGLPRARTQSWQLTQSAEHLGSPHLGVWARSGRIGPCKSSPDKRRRFRWRPL